MLKQGYERTCLMAGIFIKKKPICEGIPAGDPDQPMTDQNSNLWPGRNWKTASSPGATTNTD